MSTAPGSSRWKMVVGLALHLALVATPMLARLAKLPDVRLYGVVEAQTPPTFGWPGWRDGTIQESAQQRMESQLGFRGILVRSDNSLQGLTGDTKPGSRVLRGDHGTLFLDEDVRAFTRRVVDVPDLARVRELADLLADVQQTLARRGTPLIVIVSPSKTSIYPEDVPARWRVREPGGEARGAALANALRDRLRERGASFTDSATVLRTAFGNDEAMRQRLFGKGGRHWTAAGACLVIQQAFAAPFPGFQCAPSTEHAPIGGDWDSDLLVLLNRWELVTEVDGLRPRHTGPPFPERKPLFVGTSFSLGLLEWFRGSITDLRFFYYNRTALQITATANEELGKVDASSPTWLKLTGDRDLFVFEVLESLLDGDFFREHLVALRDRLPAQVRVEPAD